MTWDPSSEQSRFLLQNEDRPFWSDITRAKTLRKEIRSSLARLDFLQSKPQGNEDAIRNEMATISAASRELNELQRKLLMP